MKHFLQNDPFGNYMARVYYEWLESYGEGKDVAPFKQAASFLQDCFKSEDEALLYEWSDAAYSLGKILENAPYRKDYQYVEPNDLEDIKKESDFDKLENVECKIDDQLIDRIKGAWIGDISGCMLGKPIEFMKRSEIHRLLKETNNYPINHYPALSEFSEELIKECNVAIGRASQPWVDEWDGIAAPIDDDTNYSVLNLKLQEEYGKDFVPNDVLSAWINWVPALWTFTAERAAYINATKGIMAPHSARVDNPCREWIGALIRALAFGVVYPGNKKAAAEAAYKDACVSHTKNGIYGEMMAAVMISSALVSNNMREVVEDGLKVIPKKSRLYEDVCIAIKDFDNGVDYETAIDHVHDKWKESSLFDWCHTNPNAMILVISLLYSKNDFTSVIGNCVQAGFDSDSTTAIAGAIKGALLGQKNIPSYWPKQWQYRLYSSVSGYENMSIDDLTDRTIKMITGQTEENKKTKNAFEYKKGFDD